MKNCPQGCSGCLTEVCFCNPNEDEDANKCFDKLEKDLDMCLEDCDRTDQERALLFICI